MEKFERQMEEGWNLLAKLDLQANNLDAFPKSSNETTNVKMDSASPNKLAQKEKINDHITIDFIDLKTKTDMRIQAHSQPTLCIAVILKGFGCFSVSNGGWLPVMAGNTILFYSTEATVGHDLIPGGQHVQTLNINIDPAYAEKHMGIDLELFKLSKQHLFAMNARDKTAWMGILASTPNMVTATHQLFDCQLIGTARSLLCQAKVMEIISGIIAELELENEAFAKNPSFSPSDRRRLMYARKLLLMRVDFNWTISELADQTGLNESKLKTGFRLMTGSSIYAFLQQQRMNKAAEMLLTNDNNIVNVALAVGYSSPGHFAKIFKRQYGLSPAKFRALQ